MEFYQEALETPSRPRPKSRKEIVSTIKKKTVKFCPICASLAFPVKDGPHSVCESCGFTFWVSKKDDPIIAQPDGSAFRKECGMGVGKNGGKAGFDTVEAAYARSLTLIDIPHRHREKMQFYLCRWCSRFHLGHAGKGRKHSTVSFTYAQAKAAFEASQVPDCICSQLQSQ